MSFILDATLESDTFFVMDLSLSTLLLMDDIRYPWLILVPKRANTVEIYDLAILDQQQLIFEVSSVARWAKRYFSAYKMNIGSLGNIVPQLHVHIIARKKEDYAWPKPVWGVGMRETYIPEKAHDLVNSIRQDLLLNTQP